ncbi:GGDEF domain-containing protein [Acidaminobacter sp. JC074]|uniref:GGDEF domain-containing protein n=1 Tax=Acidaminobacter sp. JC074 TaxID=2530199 RepID=UPI001F0E54C7|nr:GGDEF domain-containing protein [Acidaminobacter sp. JC074]MCH4889596.1 GGDEF domain-containing protein [Acidaminobacter sp. JC074]
MISLTSIYTDLYMKKKAQYTLFFLALIVVYSSLSLLVSLMLGQFDWILLMSYLGWLLIAYGIYKLLVKGYLESAINVFSIAGIAKGMLLYFLPVGIYFYVHMFLIIFIVSAIKYKEYQIKSIFIIAYLMTLIRSMQADLVGIYDTSVRLVSYRISIVIGVLMFILVLYYLSRIVDREIRNIERYDKLSKTDTLTGVSNRLAFNMDTENLNRKVTNGLLILDLDHFKKINDSFGHMVGDQVLKSFADLLFQYLNDKGKLYRIGGEEFAILYKNIDRTSLDDFCHEIIELVANADFDISQKVTVSIGAVYVEELTCSDFEDCYRASDKALYRAKETGRNKYVLV